MSELHKRLLSHEHLKAFKCGRYLLRPTSKRQKAVLLVARIVLTVLDLAAAIAIGLVLLSPTLLMRVEQETAIKVKVSESDLLTGLVILTGVLIVGRGLLDYAWNKSLLNAVATAEAQSASDLLSQFAIAELKPVDSEEVVFAASRGLAQTSAYVRGILLILANAFTVLALGALLFTIDRLLASTVLVLMIMATVLIYLLVAKGIADGAQVIVGESLATQRLARKISQDAEGDMVLITSYSTQKSLGTRALADQMVRLRVVPIGVQVLGSMIALLLVFSAASDVSSATVDRVAAGGISLFVCLRLIMLTGPTLTGLQSLSSYTPAITRTYGVLENLGLIQDHSKTARE